MSAPVTHSEICPIIPNRESSHRIWRTRVWSLTPVCRHMTRVTLSTQPANFWQSCGRKTTTSTIYSSRRYFITWNTFFIAPRYFYFVRNVLTLKHIFVTLVRYHDSWVKTSNVSQIMLPSINNLIYDKNSVTRCLTEDISVTHQRKWPSGNVLMVTVYIYIRSL